MNPDRDKEFEQNMSQFITLLRKLMKSLPGQAGSFSQAPTSGQNSNSQGINLNICFFSFLPLSGEEMDAMEEMYDQYLSQNEDKLEDFSTDLNSSDIDFLRENGISF